MSRCSASTARATRSRALRPGPGHLRAYYPSSEFVSLPNCGHNDKFNGAAYRLDRLDCWPRFSRVTARWGGGRVLGEGKLDLDAGAADEGVVAMQG